MRSAIGSCATGVFLLLAACAAAPSHDDPAASLAGLRLEVPCADHFNNGTECHWDRTLLQSEDARWKLKREIVRTFGGKPGVTYQVTLRVRGVVEPKNFSGGDVQARAFPDWRRAGEERLQLLQSRRFGSRRHVHRESQRGKSRPLHLCHRLSGDDPDPRRRDRDDGGIRLQRRRHRQSRASRGHGRAAGAAALRWTILRRRRSRRSSGADDEIGITSGDGDDRFACRARACRRSRATAAATTRCPTGNTSTW